MASYALTYTFGLGEYFSRHGFMRGGLSYIGGLFRTDAKELINMQLTKTSLPFVAKECSQHENPCGLCLAGADGTVVRGILFHGITGDANFDLPGDARRCGEHAHAILAALTMANRLFERVTKTPC